MADKKDSSGGKPGDAAASGKKPTPLLDLKATEVRSAGDSASKPPSTTSNLKGAPNWKDPKAAAQSTQDSSGKASASAATSGSSTAKPADSSATGGKEPTSTAAKMASATPPPSRGGDTKPSVTGSVPSSAPKASDTKPTEKKPEASKPAAAKAETHKTAANSSGATSAPKPASTRSGGGFASTVSHLAAGVIGGGIALFAAGPLDQQFGLGLSQAPAVPAAFEQRLAALESKPASSGGSDGSLKADVEALSGKVDAAEKRLAELDALGKQVAGLTKDVAAARSATPAGNSGNASAPAQNVAEPSELRARLAKLESAMSTLSSATSSNGEPAGIAPLAQFSAKFADLESSLNAQLASLRKGLLGEMDTRIASTSEASTKAAAGTERLNREVSEIKTDTARLEQRSVVLKSASDKLAATTRAVSEQAAELKVELDALKGSLNQELAKVARPADLESAIAPVSAKIASIEKNLGSVIASETARKQNAERIVLSLELSNLKRVLDRGTPYAAELADVKKVAGDSIDFGALEAHKSEGVPSGQALTRQFSKVAFDIINAQSAPKDDSRINRLLAAAKSIVQVRRTDVPVKENTAEAAVARIEKRLKDGDMSGALSLAEKLPDEAKAPAKGWMSQLAARAGVDRAIAKIENQLKASLGAGAANDKS